MVLAVLLDILCESGIMRLTAMWFSGGAMVVEKRQDPKEEALRAARALNPRPEAVRAAEFAGSEFFDPRDLVQVKYEMLRCATQDGATVSDASATFGFSRPSFYEAKVAYEAAGLPGLLPKRPGPRRAHKLSAAVVERLVEASVTDPALSSADLAGLVQAEFGVSVHPRSVERALARHPKGQRGPTP